MILAPDAPIPKFVTHVCQNMSRIIGKISLYINYDVGFFARDVSVVGSPKETQVPFKRMLKKPHVTQIIAVIAAC